MDDFKREIKAAIPACRVLLPGRFQSYPVNNLISK
jgi:hypothetical protein